MSTNLLWGTKYDQHMVVTKTRHRQATIPKGNRILHETKTQTSKMHWLQMIKITVHQGQVNKQEQNQITKKQVPAYCSQGQGKLVFWCKIPIHKTYMATNIRVGVGHLLTNKSNLSLCYDPNTIKISMKQNFGIRLDHWSHP